MKLAGVAIPLGVALLALVAVGCSGGTSNADKTATAAAKGGANPTQAATTPATSATAAATKATSGSPTSGGASKQIAITAKDFSFSADGVDVSKGDMVAITFKNSGATTHTLAFYTDNAYTNPIAGADTGNVSAGDSKPLTVKADVGLFYRCNIHPTQMMGEITIK
jgi:plastocyanin